MTTISCFSLRTGDKIEISKQDALCNVERAEKKTFARHEALDLNMELQKRNSELIVIMDDDLSHQGSMILVAYMVSAHIKPAGTVSLHKICVVGRYRHQGVGRRLLTTQIEKLKKQGAVKIQLWVDENNTPARNLYEGTGFKEVRRVSDYYNVGRTGIQMIMKLL